MKLSRVALGLVVTAALVSGGLLLSGKRVLILEHRINPGETYVVSDHGNLGDSKQASLVCRYFTGRSIVTTVLWYSPNNVLGRDQCPFVSDQFN